MKFNQRQKHPNFVIVKNIVRKANMNCKQNINPWKPLMYDPDSFSVTPLKYCACKKSYC